MPYCTQCGTRVEETDLYCPFCGTKQDDKGSGKGASTPPGAKPPNKDFLVGMSPRTASILCYIPWVGWIAAIVVLASERFRENRDVRFHAFQGLYLFVAWLFVDWVFEPFTSYAAATQFLGKALKLTVLGTWILMLVKTSQDQRFRLPILGDLADRSVSEQR